MGASHSSGRRRSRNAPDGISAVFSHLSGRGDGWAYVAISCEPPSGLLHTPRVISALQKCHWHKRILIEWPSLIYLTVCIDLSPASFYARALTFISWHLIRGEASMTGTRGIALFGVAIVTSLFIACGEAGSS